MEKTNPITKISDAMCSVEKFVTWIAFAIMLALLLIQVLCRYCFDMPLAWAEEMVRYVYIGVSFTGAIVAVREESHIGIDILPVILQKLIKNEVKKQTVQERFEVVACILAAAFIGLLSVWMVGYNIDLMNLGQFTTANEWQMWIMCLPVTISLILMCVHYILLAIEKVLDILSLKKGAVQ